jgi:hypothetical protein
MHYVLFSDVLDVSQASCNSIIDSDEPDFKPYLSELFFDRYGIDDF